MPIGGWSALGKPLESIELPSVIQKEYSFYILSLLHSMNQHMWRQLGYSLQKHSPQLTYNANLSMSLFLLTVEYRQGCSQYWYASAAGMR